MSGLSSDVHPPSNLADKPIATPEPWPVPTVSTQPAQGADLEKTKEEMLAQLNQTENSNRSLALPKPPPRPRRKKVLPPAPKLSPEEQARLEGRKKRSVLPMGVVLEDRTAVYS